VLLNRAPTLHRLGIQAFEPILVEGRALKIHPLVCTAYNADFDGDQMAVHVPLSVEAQSEARLLMLAANNILKPQDGKPVVSPTQDMVLGCYYLTIERPGAQGEGKMFSGIDEAVMAYACGELHLQAKAFIRVSKEIDGVEYHKMLNTTVGRMIFNEAIPQDLGFVERTTPEQILDLEIDKLIDKKELGKIVDRCYRRYGASETSRVLDNIKRLGFK
jgi:DNA-directed RNA polymerase subunit beta'